LREKSEEGFTTEFAEGTEEREGGTPSPFLRKDVILGELGVHMVQGCDSKWFRSVNLSFEIDEGAYFG